MRVAYISYSKIPSREANSVHVMKMCQAYTREGYDTTLYAPCPKEGPLDPDTLWRRYGISEPFSIEYVLVRHYPLTMLKDHGYAMETAFRCRKSGAALVHTRHLYSAMWTSLLGIPTVYEVHYPVLGGRLGALYYRTLLKGRGFRKLAVITHALKRLFPKGPLDDGDVIVAPDGIDLERFEHLPGPEAARETIGIKKDAFTVGYAGHLYAGRGVELIFSLAETLPDVTFIVAGGREEDIERVRGEAAAGGLSNIVLTGFVDNSDLPLYLAACEVLLMPYQRKVATINPLDDTSAFMSPMKMFEYMATGRLIISSDLPVLREILNGDNAVLCPPEDPEAWRAAVEKAAADRDWRESLASRALSDVKEYTWQKRVRRIINAALPQHPLLN